jgi:hypothetical protein
MGTLLSPSQECHPFYPSSLSHDLVVSAKKKGQAIVIKYFFSVSLDRIFFQILDHFPEKLVFTKSAFDPDLEFLIPPEVDLIIPKI